MQLFSPPSTSLTNDEQSTNHAYLEATSFTNHAQLDDSTMTTNHASLPATIKPSRSLSLLHKDATELGSSPHRGSSVCRPSLTCIDMLRPSPSPSPNDHAREARDKLGEDPAESSRVTE
jgi:hypothetical protein